MYWKKAIVLFRAHPTVWWQHFLKKGFRHCAILLQSESHWLYIEQSFFQTHFRVWDASFSPVDSFKKEGWRVVEWDSVAEDISSFRWGWFDCVAMVKRSLGIKKWFILTPYQLYRYLRP